MSQYMIRSHVHPCRRTPTTHQPHAPPPFAPFLMVATSEEGDFVYARFTFEAENEDELSFEAGERIRVTQRDEQYGDGWFEVGSEMQPDALGQC